MPLETVQHDYTSVPGKLPSHRWLGANTAIPTVYGYTEQLEKTKQYLAATLQDGYVCIEKSNHRGSWLPRSACRR